MAQTIAAKRQRRGAVIAGLASLGCGVGVGLLAHAGGAALPQAVLLAALALVFILAIIGTVPWWRSLDPMQREGQYFSWYWGGTAGLATAFIGLIVFAGMDSAMLIGAVWLGAGQVAGFFLFWLWWTLRHRGAAE